MVAEILNGRNAKTTGVQLCSQLGISDRELRRQIQAERLNGAPICAEVEEGGSNGYYLGDAEDCLRNVRNLQHKANGIRKSWKALAETAKRLGDKEKQLNGELNDETLMSYFKSKQERSATNNK